eukprot:TRINITY_DN20157_c0_g1_i1.p1 TRINITY_DN20157_c0_g1~~TRINITY_DN20157_c0_g1_i1.p1  ORF type:complete len:240 (-),score=60.48 TRINITY_DN20157_c0_g1_i1:411-1130(-)
MRLIDEQHRAEMDALRREHEIAMAAQEASNPANKNKNEALHLREWNLSHLDSIHTQQKLDRIHAHKSAISARSANARSDEVRRLMDKELSQSRSHLARLEQIEMDHRARMMRAAEQHARLEHHETIDAVNSGHAETMASMRAEHEAALDDLKRDHDSKMTNVAANAPLELVSAQCSLGALGPGPDQGFGVATQQLLWSLGVEDRYSDQHNLARKLETAIRAVAAEQPADPCSRLAQLLA